MTFTIKTSTHVDIIANKYDSLLIVYLFLYSFHDFLERTSTTATPYYTSRQHRRRWCSDLILSHVF